MSAQEPTLTEYLDAETTQAGIRTSILAALAALRQFKITNGRTATPEQSATVITACVLEALRPIAPPEPQADEAEQLQMKPKVEENG